VSVRRGLPVGDYSLEGYESVVAVERKSLDDFVGTVIRARGRFERELDCLKEFELGVVVVEATHEDVLQHRYRANVHPNAVLGAAVAITVDHHVPVLWCTDRQHACAYVERLLLRFYEKRFPQAA
jgi:ERCC4-type nuclease